MQDSEEKKPEQPEQVKVPAISEEIIVHPDGKTRIMLRGEGGKFQKKKKSVPETKEIVRYMRELLNKAEAGPDGKIISGSKTRFRRMFDNIFEIATMSPEQPVLDKFGNPVMVNGKPLTVKDAKIAMASVQAWKELMLRAHGMPSKSDEELESMKTQGVKVVIITPPEEFMNKEIKEEKPREKITPDFLEAEIVENKF